MSSSYVRDQFLAYLKLQVPTETFIDMDGEIDTLQDLLSNESVGMQDPWVGLSYIGNDEIPISLPANGNKGCYRELGSIHLHIAEMAQIAVAAKILPRAKALIDCLRGVRINDMVIEKVTPPNFGQGATLELSGGYTSASIIVDYYRDLNL
jgi:hypothetical protein